MKIIKPINSSRRFLKQISFKNTFLKYKGGKKSLKTKLNGLFGRDSKGTITVRHKGGGHKKMYRFIDFKRAFIGVQGVVLSIEYDPNRNCNISLIHYPTLNTYKYILAPENLKISDYVVNYKNNPLNYNFGSSCKLKYIPVGLYIHLLENLPNSSASVVRSAGLKVFIVGFYKKKEKAIIKLPSGETKYFSYNCRASFGTVGNKDHFNSCLGKAGRRRWLGVRPTVRGVAMNPVDHPMGGGEGKTSGGKHPVSPWNKLSKGGKTIKSGKLKNNYRILNNRKGIKVKIKSS